MDEWKWVVVWWWGMLGLSLGLVGCGDPGDRDTGEENRDSEEGRRWSVLEEAWPAALLSVNGRSGEDFWVVGARRGEYPRALLYREGAWEVHEVPFEVDLWWVHVTPEGTPYFGGSDGAVIRFDGEEFARIDTFSLARHTVFGITGSDEDLYAVGGIGGRSGFVAHYDGEVWTVLGMPGELELMWNGAMPGLFKAWSDGSGTVWIVGADGTVLKREGAGPLEVVEVDTEETLFTVHGSGDDVVAVGGGAQGVVVQLSSVESETPEVIDLEGAFLQGVHVLETGEAVAVGGYGEVWARARDGSWAQETVESDLFVESLHAVWVSKDGRRVAVGGNVISPQLDEGVIYVAGVDGMGAARRPEVDAVGPEAVECPEEVVYRGAEKSVARRWIEQNLAAIRLEIPEPVVHARNLYHLSLVMFEVWALFDEVQTTLLVEESEVAGLLEEARALDDLEEARAEALSYGAHRLLRYRYGVEVGARGVARTGDCVDRVLMDLGYELPGERVGAEELSAAGRLGRAVADEVITAFVEDGALELKAYQDGSYEYPAPPLVVDDPGVQTEDPTWWQPLDLAQAVTQNGIAVEAGVQGYIGPHWRDVRPFALERQGPGEPYFAPGERPQMGEEMKAWVVDVIQRTAWLDISDGVVMDISPGSYGNNSLGADDGEGHEVNPVTGEPYAAQVVKRGDFGRVLAEFWADGPDSETPPGHWNRLANEVMDHPLFARRFYGEGDEVEALRYDVHLYLVLNGALHDAAIVAWEVKRLYETARPITLIRWMGSKGQSSDPAKESYHEEGLPLVEGLIELITAESVQPGERHEHLRPYVGQIALFNWPGAPGDAERRHSPCVWIRAVEWTPYQPRTFVAPAFPGYVSGHSTFSHSAALVLARLTGSAYFPGGLGEFVAGRNEYLEFENGPSGEIRLQWATYFDAADQAGQSRIWGGIHILPDDLEGRRLGALVGEKAVEWGADRLELLGE